ncbi:MAG: hypothetical protein IT306_09195 [Chloroflexi bacterium]|nr:hypothetical protein [Chloroflexota bacterium]
MTAPYRAGRHPTATTADLVDDDLTGPLTVLAVVGGLIWAAAVGLLVFYLLVYVAHTTNLARYPYDLDQGEGYDLNSGLALARGLPIYTDNSRYPYYSSNYPPVFSAILSAIVQQTGPTLAAGRLLSATAALLTALLIGAVVYARKQVGLAALTAGLLYLGSVYVFHTTPLARVNALAVLFGLAGVACCLGRGWRWGAAAAVCFLLALYTKQTTIDAVAAGLLALALRDLRLGVAVGAVVGVVGGVLLLLLNAATDGGFWVNVVVGNVNPFDAKQAVDYYLNFLHLHLIVVGLAALEVFRAVRTRQPGPLELYWIFSMLLAISVGKWGAGESYFLAPIAASAVLAGQTFARLQRNIPYDDLAIFAGGAMLLIQAILLSHGPLYRLGPSFTDGGAQASVLSRWPGEPELRAASDLVQKLREADGPVLLEDPSYGIAAGKEVVGNATHLRNVYQAGRWSPDGLVADLRERRFSWVVLNAELYPEPVLAAIGRYYYLYETYEINGTTQQLFAPGDE